MTSILKKNNLRRGERRIWNYFCDWCEIYMPEEYCDECDDPTILWTDEMKDFRTATKDRREVTK